MKSLCVTLLLLVAGQTAFANPEQTVDDLNLIDLLDDASVIERVYNYPGLGGGEEARPDCLILVTGSYKFDQPENGLETLRDALQVFDGDEVLFPNGQRTLNTLDGLTDQGILVYYVKDLHKFVTGLRISTKNGQSLKSVVQGVGFQGSVALQVVRGCRVLPAAL